jgi:hypothetical protein
MSKTKAYLFSVLSLLVTRHEFTRQGIRIIFFRAIPFTIPFDSIAICDTKTSHYRCVISSNALEDTHRRVFIRTHSGFCIAIRPSDADAFIEALESFAPHVRIRPLKETWLEFP